MYSNPDYLKRITQTIIDIIPNTYDLNEQTVRTRIFLILIFCLNLFDNQISNFFFQLNEKVLPNALPSSLKASWKSQFKNTRSTKQLGQSSRRDTQNSTDNNETIKVVKLS